MGIERFERLVDDLRYSRKSFAEALQRYVATAQVLPNTSPFKSFFKQPSLKGFPVIDKGETLECLLLGNYALYDRAQISLADFIRHESTKVQWKNTPTRDGRTYFLEAFTNLQKVLVVYYGMHFITCCKDVIEILDEDDDVLRTFNDSYTQAKFEVVISQFFQDIYREKSSLLHPELLMDTPTKCAALLRTYMSDQVQAANGEKGKESNWEPHPHSFFYSAEGEYQKIKFSPTPSDIVKSKICASGISVICFK
jgi:hypothetical protein